MKLLTTILLILISLPAFSQVGKVGSPSSATKDSSTNATTVIDYEHHEIHGGSHYSTYRFVFESHVDNVVLDYCSEWYEHTNKN